MGKKTPTSQGEWGNPVYFSLLLLCSPMPCPPDGSEGAAAAPGSSVRESAVRAHLQATTSSSPFGGAVASTAWVQTRWVLFVIYLFIYY